MLAILEFLDRHAVDPHIFFTVSNGEGSGAVELYWERSRGSEKWCVRTSDKLRTEYVNFKNLESVLARWKVPLAEAELQLRNVALTQVFFAQSLLVDATKLFGQAQLDSAAAEHQLFLNSLKELVFSLTSKPLSVLPGEGQGDSSRSKARLSLVPQAANPS